jgi:hypothetical protein
MGWDTLAGERGDGKVPIPTKGHTLCKNRFFLGISHNVMGYVVGYVLISELAFLSVDDITDK